MIGLLFVLVSVFIAFCILMIVIPVLNLTFEVLGFIFRSTDNVTEEEALKWLEEQD